MPDPFRCAIKRRQRLQASAAISAAKRPTTIISPISLLSQVRKVPDNLSPVMIILYAPGICGLNRAKPQ